MAQKETTTDKNIPGEELEETEVGEFDPDQDSKKEERKEFFMKKTFRNVFMTINNWTEDDIKTIQNWTQVTYYVIGKEIGKKNGTPHLQIYMELANSVKGKTLKNKFPRAYMARRIATAKQASDYCKKEGDFLEWGEMKEQGKRTDLQHVADLLIEGKTTVDDLTIENPMVYHQYGRTLQKIEEIQNRKKFRKWMTKGLWLYGPSGVGKTRYWQENFNPETDYKLNIYDNGFWDGYTGQERVIIDEFRGQIMYSELLNLMDRCPHTVKRKGLPPVPLLAKEIIITSCLHPREVYHNLSVNDSLKQLERRCEIRYMGGNEKSSESGSAQEGNTVPLSHSPPPQSPRQLL